MFILGCVCKPEVNLNCCFLAFSRQGLSLPWTSPSRPGWLATELWGSPCLLLLSIGFYFGSIVLRKTMYKGSVPIREGNQRATGSGQGLASSGLLPPGRPHLQIPEHHHQVVTKTSAHEPREPDGTFQTMNSRQSLVFSQGFTHAPKAFSKGEDLLLSCLWSSSPDLQFPDSAFSFSRLRFTFLY